MIKDHGVVSQRNQYQKMCFEVEVKLTKAKGD